MTLPECEAPSGEASPSMTEAEGADWEVEFEDRANGYRARFRLGEDGILYSVAEGFETLDSAKRIVATLRDFQRKEGSPVRCCLDVRGYTGQQPESRKYMRDSVLGEDSPMRAFAVIGGNLLTRSLFNMFARISRIPLKVFKTRESAVAWLEER